MTQLRNSVLIAFLLSSNLVLARCASVLPVENSRLWREFPASEKRMRAMDYSMESKTFGTVITGDLCSIFTCERCPGFVKAAELPDARLKDTSEAPDPETTVFCIHWCHQEPAARNLE